MALIADASLEAFNALRKAYLLALATHLGTEVRAVMRKDEIKALVLESLVRDGVLPPSASPRGAVAQDRTDDIRSVAFKDVCKRLFVIRISQPEFGRTYSDVFFPLVVVRRYSGLVYHIRSAAIAGPVHRAAC